MNLTDYIAIFLSLVGLWGLATAIPNWRIARSHQDDLRARGINGMNGRLAKKETRLHRNIAFGLAYIVVLGVLVAAPTIHLWGTTLAGLWLTLGLSVWCVYLAFWSRAERDDGESALREVTRIVRERMAEMEQKNGNSD